MGRCWLIMLKGKQLPMNPLRSRITKVIIIKIRGLIQKEKGALPLSIVEIEVVIVKHDALLAVPPSSGLCTSCLSQEQELGQAQRRAVAETAVRKPIKYFQHSVYDNRSRYQNC